MSKIVVRGFLLLIFMAVQVQSKRFTANQMFGQVINDLPDDNVVVCPLAVDVSLTQLYLAAGGATATALKTDLAIKETSKGNIYKNPFPAWVSEEIRIAGRLFARTGTSIQPQFQSTHGKYLNTEMQNVEIGDKWPLTINKWAISQTDPSLEDLIDAFDGLESVFVSSAVNFFGSWKYPFKDIGDSTFYVSDESRAEKVKMMQVAGTFKYTFLQNIECHLVIIPFSKSNIEMALLIPRNFYEISKIEEGLNTIDFSKTDVRKVNISLPQFKFRYSRDMIQTLIEIGVDKNVFANTDVSELIADKKKASIDSIMHSTIIQVDPEGVKSAFATGIDMWSTSPPTVSRRRRSTKEPILPKDQFLVRKKRAPPKPVKPPAYVDLEVNRPFLFVVRDSKNMYFFGRFSYPA